MQPAVDIGKLTEAKAVQVLDLSAFDREDYVNLILQRSEVMFDVPKSGAVIRAWGQQDHAPIDQVVASLGSAIGRRAAGVIHAEYQALVPLLRRIKPKRIADIGCGYGLFDLFAAKALKAAVILIDLENNERRHFGFQSEGAAYSSLAKARKLLEDNGVPSESITTLNPAEIAPETIEPVDLVVSFLSCGFHYPVDIYLPFLKKCLVPGGTAIFDLREATADAQASALAELGEVTNLPGPAQNAACLVAKGRRMTGAVVDVLPSGGKWLVQDNGSAVLVGEGDPVPVPSGQQVTLQDVIWNAPGAYGLTLRFRFLAPAIARKGGSIDFETAAADMQALCETYALQRLADFGPAPTQIIISMSDVAVPFGEAAPDATQFFEAYRIEDGACIWEAF